MMRQVFISGAFFEPSGTQFSPPVDAVESFDMHWMPNSWLGMVIKSSAMDGFVAA